MRTPEITGPDIRGRIAITAVNEELGAADTGKRLGARGAWPGPCCSAWLFGEVFVGQLGSDGALADGGGYAFDGPVAYVPGGEDSGQTGL